MSWMRQCKCPVCGSTDFIPDCDEVDIGVGVQEFNFRGTCENCGEMYQCPFCSTWITDETEHVCTDTFKIRG
jgi:hypothetical protein